MMLCLMGSPLAAQSENDGDTIPDTLQEFADSMRKLFEGFADDVAPLMEDLATRLEGLQGYHPPEVLENGDIIIRKKTPQEREAEPDAPIEDPIEL